MENLAKINLKIGEIEISIEGPTEFVSQQYDKVQDHLRTYSELSQTVTSPTNVNQQIEEKQNAENTGAVSTPADGGKLPESFGEWVHKLPKGATDTDKALLAGYFHQIQTENKVFKVRDVTKTLKDHGIKLSNPSNLITLATKGKKFIFQISKDGIQINYRFSREGETYIKDLLLGQKDE